jgi:polygalacturonase
LGPPNPDVGDQCTQWKKLKNVTITGGGIIDGSGSVWWGNTNNTRPTLLGLFWVDGLVIANLTIQNSPFWNVHPTFSNHIEIYGLNIYAPSNSPNTDGIDPDSSSNIYIHDCTIDVGDDCIAIKSGKDLNGRQVGIITENLLIERMFFKHGHGVSIGSEMSGGVRNVTIRNCDCSGTDRAVRIKTCRGRGGVVEYIYYDNFTVPNVTEAININMYYCDNPPTNASATPIFRNLFVNNLNATTSKQVGEVMCLPESPCQNISFTNIVVKSYTTAWTCEYGYGTQSNVTPPACLLPPGAYVAPEPLIEES